MEDVRMKKLSENLLKYSMQLKENEKVLIEVEGEEGIPLAKELIKQAYAIKAIPFFNIISYKLLREMLCEVSEEQARLYGEIDVERLKKMDAYIGISACENRAELSDVPMEKLLLYNQNYILPVHINERVKNKKWCILRYPNNSIAQQSNMSLEKFEDFYYAACNLDYEKLSKAMDPLVELMNKTDKVHILSNNTNLTFSIKGIGAEKYVGNYNLPDGEVASAPVLDSVNGYITYNTESKYNGYSMNNIRFEFENGKIIKATSTNTAALNKLLDIDEGARYIGEFAFGLNPYIKKTIGDILFDEKVSGSFHLTPGESLEKCGNGNKSSIHWDIISIESLECGGGEIWFDDVLIRKNGKFLIDNLKELNFN